MTLSSALMNLSATIASYIYSSAMTTMAEEDPHHAEEHQIFIGKMVSIPIIFILVLGKSGINT